MHFKSNKEKTGLILIDIILALALGTFFVALITYSSVNAEDIFETALERNYALDLYETHKDKFEGMMPYESRSITIPPILSITNILEDDFAIESSSFVTTTINTYAHWYGNDRIQTDISIATDTKRGITPLSPILFNAVRTYPFQNISESISSSLCSVDFSSKEYIGSYRFQHPSALSNLTNSFSASTDNFVKQPKSLVASIVPIILPINPTLLLTDIEVRNNIAYISIDSSVAVDPDLIVVDITNVKNPTIISTINTGPGISSIALVGNRIYAAAASTAAQLHIVRYDGLDSPILEKKYSLPLPYATATPSMASSIAYEKNIVYLGTDKWNGEEFSVIDVTNPVVPNVKGSIEIGSRVMDIFARNGSSYIGTAGERQLIKLDISDPNNPIITDDFNPSGWERQEGKIISFFEDGLRLGRTSGGFNIKQDHELFSWATSSVLDNPPLLLSNSMKNSIDLPSGVYGLIADRSYVYVVSKAVDKELQVFDYAFSTTTSAAFSLPVAPRTMTCDGDKLYILAGTAPVIYQISFR